MTESNARKQRIGIGRWTVDRQLNRLEAGNGDVVNIEPLTAELLIYLAEHAGELATRDVLVRDVWRRGDVSDQAINIVVAKARKALGDDIEYIETIPKRGYRLVAPVRASDEQVAGADSQSLAQTSPVVRRVMLAGFLSLVGMTLLLASLLDRGDVHPVSDEHALDRRLALATVEPVTRYNGLAGDGGAWMDLVAFSAVDRSGTQLVRVERLGSAAPILIRDPDNRPLSHPQIAPTGERLAYLRLLDSDSLFPVYQIVIHDLSSGQSRVAAVTQGVLVNFDWSDDGARILFSHSQEGADNRPSIAELVVDSGEMTVLTNPQFADFMPRYVPGTDDISFVRLPDPGRSDLYLLRDGVVIRLTTENTFMLGHDWLDSSTYIASIYARGDYRAMIGSLASTGLKDAGLDPGFQWPNVVDDWVYYTERYVTLGVNLISLSETNRTWRIESPGRYLRDPSFHPSRPKILFSDDRTGYSEIWSAALDGTDERQITRAQKRLLNPQWSPNGEIIYARLLDRASPPPRPVLVDPKSGEIWDATDRRGAFAGAHFTRDGRALIAIYAQDGVTELWRLPVDRARANPDELLIYRGALDEFQPLALGGVAIRVGDQWSRIEDHALDEAPEPLDRAPGQWRWETGSTHLHLQEWIDPYWVERAAIELIAVPHYGRSVSIPHNLAAYSRYGEKKQRFMRVRWLR